MLKGLIGQRLRLLWSCGHVSFDEAAEVCDCETIVCEFGHRQDMKEQSHLKRCRFGIFNTAFSSYLCAAPLQHRRVRLFNLFVSRLHTPPGRESGGAGFQL